VAALNVRGNLSEARAPQPTLAPSNLTPDWVHGVSLRARGPAPGVGRWRHQHTTTTAFEDVIGRAHSLSRASH
jgi:hypothetical protein